VGDVGTVTHGSGGVRRGYEEYQLLNATFIEMDTGDARYLQSLSRLIFGAGSDIVLTISHFWALVHLEPEEGRTMAELAQLLLCDKSNVTAIVDRLEEREWAVRMRGKAGDRRFTSVVLTPAGRALRERVVRAHGEWVSMRFAELPDEQLAQLATLLRALRLGLQADPELAARATDPGAPVAHGRKEERAAGAGTPQSGGGTA
jgi:DNA-binding MarR family transcriptional regulator